ncbi:MAG: hypothetical protein K1Y36_05965 [Blastocatellia bacterium]|nr:hypothetical protein [Blastocatellia bacterium]
MNTCKRIRQHLELADFMAEDSFSLAIEQHLATCAECRRFQSEMLQLKHLLKTEQRVSAPADFELRLQIQIRRVRAEQRTVWLPWIPTPALSALAVVVVCTVVLSVYTSIPGPTGISQDPTAAHKPTPNSGPVQLVQPKPLKPEPAEGLSLVMAATGSTEPQNRPSPRSNRQHDLNPDKVLVLVRDQNNTENFVTVPTVIFGAQPVINTNAPRTEPADDAQHIF